MKYLKQISIILLFSFLGEVCRALIPFPIPASIYGMVLMAAALGLKLFRPEDVRDVGSFLTSILPILFVVPLVNLMDCWDQLKSHLLPILLILIGSTVLCFAVSGRITQWYVGRKEKKHD